MPSRGLRKKLELKTFKWEGKPEWQFIVSMALQVVRGKTRLFVGVQPAPDNRFAVLALETIATTRGKDMLAAGNAVLDQHSHDLVGIYDFATAVKTAETYARRWRPGQKPDCTCGPISAPKKAKAARRRPAPAPSSARSRP